MKKRNLTFKSISVSRFCRRKTLRRVFAGVSAFMLLVGGALPATAGRSVLNGNSVLENMTRVTMGANTADAVTFNAAAGAKVGVLDWSKYNIGVGQSMTYNGKGVSFFNLIDGAGGKSQIDGMINGNGNVWVINPSGIAFGARSIVNVGGIFTAAAGSLDADSEALIRGGTMVETPTFVTTGGEGDDKGIVTVASGAQFHGADIDLATGDWKAGKQVALVGKQVKVADGVTFKADQVSIAAGAKVAGKVTIDEVEGGKVTLNIADFANDDTGIGVEVGGGDDGDDFGGGLDIVTEGNIDLKSAIKADGVIEFKTLAKPASEVVTGHKQISVASGKYLQGKSVSGTAAGKIAVNGSIESVGDGDADDVTLVAGTGIEIGSAASITAVKNVNLTATANDVVVNGAVTAGVNVGMNAKGSVTGAGAVAATSGKLAATAATGKIELTGVVTANGDAATLTAENGGVSAANALNDFKSVTAAGKSVSLADKDDVILTKVAATGGDAKATAGDAINVNGPVAAADGGVLLRGKSVTTKATDGSITATGNVRVNATDGDITLGAAVKGKNISVIAENSGSINQNADVEATAGTIDVEAAKGVTMASGVNAVTGNQNVRYAAKDGDVTIATVNAGTGVFQAEATGRVVQQAGGSISAGSIQMKASQIGSEDKLLNLNVEELAINAPNGIYVSNGKAVTITTLNGDGEKFYVNRVEETLTDDTLTQIPADDSTSAQPIVGLAAENGNVVLVNAGTITVDADVTAKEVALTANATSTPVDAGDIVVNKSVTATTGNATLKAANDAKVNGAVTAAKDVGVTAAKDVTVAKGGAVTAGIDAKLTAGTDATISGAVKATAGDVVVAAKDAVAVTGTAEVEAGKAVAVTAKDGTGDVTIDTAKGVTAKDGAVTVENQNGAVAVRNATVEAKGDAGNVDIDATTGVTIQKGTQNATVTAAKDVLVDTTAGDVLIKDATVTAGNNMHVQAVSGNVTVDDGSIVKAAQNATLIAANAVVLNSDVTATAGDAFIDAEGGNVTMKDGTTVTAGNNARLAAQGDVNLSKVKAVDAVSIVATRDVKDNLSAEGDQNNVIANRARLEAGGDVGLEVEGLVNKETDGLQVAVNAIEVKAGGNVTLSAKKNASADPPQKGDLKIGGVGSVSVDKVAANGELAVPPEKPDERIGGIHAGGSVVLNAEGGITQAEDAGINVASKGFADAKGVDMTITAGGNVRLSAGQSLGAVSGKKDGTGTTTFVGVEAGNVTAVAGGDVAVAVNPNTQVDLTAGNAAAVYVKDGALAGGSRVSAKKFNAMVQTYKTGEVELNNVKQLNVINFTKGDGGNRPLLAIFKGTEKRPTVANLPNDALIFMNGRFAGGDIKMINKLGALEAFPVQTPELKSEQGVFGNPVFVHPELDISEPVGIGVIDFLLVDPVLVHYGPQFPYDADREVVANGLSPLYTYRFDGKKNEGESERESENRPQPENGTADKK